MHLSTIASAIDMISTDDINRARYHLRMCGHQSVDTALYERFLVTLSKVIAEKVVQNLIEGEDE